MDRHLTERRECHAYFGYELGGVAKHETFVKARHYYVNLANSVTDQPSPNTLRLAITLVLIDVHWLLNRPGDAASEAHTLLTRVTNQREGETRSS